MNDCDIAENCTGNSSQVIFVSSLNETKTPSVISKSLRIGVVWCIKMVLNLLMLKKKNDTERIFHMTFVA